MEESSCVDLTGFDECCRGTDACWWKFLGCPACFLTGDIQLVLLDALPWWSGKCSSSFFSCWGFCTFFFFFLISCGYLPHTGLNCRMALDLNYFYYVLWQSIVVHREQSMFAWYPWHPHLPCFTVALRLLPGEIPGTGFCEVQCHQHTRTSLRPQWSIPVCPPQKWHTVGIFLLWMLIILANDTDMGGALRFLESSVRIQNVDQVQKSSGKK